MHGSGAIDSPASIALRMGQSCIIQSRVKTEPLYSVAIAHMFRRRLSRFTYHFPSNRILSRRISAQLVSNSKMSSETPKSGGENSANLAARVEQERSVKRNPHPDFKAVEGERPEFNTEHSGWTCTKAPDPDWKMGGGGNDGGASLEKAHVEINPHEDGRPANFNYKLMISGIVPRPIGLLSTVGADGTCSSSLYVSTPGLML